MSINCSSLSSQTTYMEIIGGGEGLGFSRAKLTALHECHLVFSNGTALEEGRFCSSGCLEHFTVNFSIPG